MTVYPLLLATLPEGRRRTRRLGTSTFFSIEGQEETERQGARRHAGRATEAQCVDSHGWERRSFGLTSLEVGGWRRPRGRRWRLASGRRKVVKWRRCWPAPQGACGVGGAPAPGSGATTPLPEAGVRKHPAPQGALRRAKHLWCSWVLLVRKHPAPEGALRLCSSQGQPGR